MRYHGIQQADRESKDGGLSMVEFINSLTGTRMWVSPERKTEYLEAGHIRVEGPSVAPAQPPAGKPPGGSEKEAGSRKAGSRKAGRTGREMR